MLIWLFLFLNAFSYNVLVGYFLQIFRIAMGINFRVLVVLLILAFGALFYIGASTSPTIVFVFSVCILSFLLSIYLTKWVLSKDEGPPEMVQVHLTPCLVLNTPIMSISIIKLFLVISSVS